MGKIISRAGDDANLGITHVVLSFWLSCLGRVFLYRRLNVEIAIFLQRCIVASTTTCPAGITIMSNNPLIVQSKLPNLGTTIFSLLSALAQA